MPGPLIEQYQSYGNTSSSSVHQVLTLYASGHFSCPISTSLSFIAHNTKHKYNYMLETVSGELGEINSNSQPQLPAELSAKPSGECLHQKLHLQLQTLCRKQTDRILCHEMVVWQVPQQKLTLLHNPMVKSTSVDLCAHENCLNG